MDPLSNMTGVLLGREGTHRHTVTTSGDNGVHIGVMYLPAKECQVLLATPESKAKLPPKAFSEDRALLTLRLGLRVCRNLRQQTHVV